MKIRKHKNNKTFRISFTTRTPARTETHLNSDGSTRKVVIEGSKSPVQRVLGCRIFWRLAFRLRTARYWVSYFFFGDRTFSKRTQNSSYHFLDASLDACIDKELGTVTFLNHVHGLSPMNVARLIQGIAENPEAKKNINRVLRQERATTQLI